MCAYITETAGVYNAFRILIDKGCIEVHVVVTDEINPALMYLFRLFFDVAYIELFPEIYPGYVPVEYSSVPDSLHIYNVRYKRSARRTTAEILRLNKKIC